MKTAEKNHLNCARSFGMFTKNKKIFEVTHKRIVSFQEPRKIVQTYTGENSYASCHGGGGYNQNKYKGLVEKSIKL